ncbi:hypothetical protein, partial [Streptomyces sp. NPDC058157]|uniref:hypothetical protein n=1 Tax=Streptomyces sp. NPDC058157 TaxID=3346360 RepID=UPI0036E31A75
MAGAAGSGPAEETAAVDLTRRRLLNALSCAGVPPVLRGRAAAGGQGRQWVPDGAAACARLLANLTELLAGTAES